MNGVETGLAAEPATTRRKVKRLAKLWAAGTGIAVALVAAAFSLAEAVGGPLIVTGAGAITLGDLIGFALFGGTVGAALAHVVERIARRPRMTFVAVTVIALAGYAAVPFKEAGSAHTAIWLNILHLVVAVPVVGTLLRYLPRSRTSVEA